MENYNTKFTKWNNSSLNENSITQGNNKLTSIRNMEHLKPKPLKDVSVIRKLISNRFLISTDERTVPWTKEIFGMKW